MKRLAFAMTLLAPLLFGPLVVYAAAVETNARIDIYPKDCVFEQVDNGTSQVTFLTPAECGQEVTITNPAPDTQTLAPVSLSIPQQEPGAPAPIITSTLIEGSVAVFMSEIALVFTTALSAMLPWTSVTAGGGVLLAIAFDPKSLSPMSVFRFVLHVIFRR